MRDYHFKGRREYLVQANLPLDGSKCPRCLFPEKFQDTGDDRRVLEVLKYMSEKKIGALPFEGKWIFPQNIRENEELATQIRDSFFIIRTKLLN